VLLLRTLVDTLLLERLDFCSDDSDVIVDGSVPCFMRSVPCFLQPVQQRAQSLLIGL
jgi:hypothetical protein